MLPELDFSRCRKEPFDHQRLGAQRIFVDREPEIGRVIPDCFALFDEMGAGKTAQVIMAAQFLFEANKIDYVIVVAPNTVRSVWCDPEIGELVTHLWTDVPSTFTEWRQQPRSWNFGAEGKRRLRFIVTNYELIRRPGRLQDLLPWATHRTLLVLDESIAVKNASTMQFKACKELRKRCAKIVILNGTPIGNNPGDLFAQCYLMDPKIIGCKNWFEFRARFAKLGGFKNKQIVGWYNLEELQEKIKPYCLRRLKKDCLDLPDKLPAVAIDVTLTDATWKIYKQMRDDMIAWLSEQEAAISSQAAVKVMRLTQITSGFVGGVEEIELPDDDVETEVDERGTDEADSRPPWVPTNGADAGRSTSVNGPGATNGGARDLAPVVAPPGLDGRLGGPTREIGREKLDVLLDWLADRYAENPKFKLVIWSRFRPEVKRIVESINEAFPHTQTGYIWGKQKKEERQRALHLLHPKTSPDLPVVVVGIIQTGAFGHNLTAAHHAIYISYDHSLFLRQQSIDRLHRPGQTETVSQYNVVASGPSGQKTIDHVIIKAVKNKESLATWTTSAWVSALSEE